MASVGRYVWDVVKQAFKPGKAKPALRPEFMRSIPESYTTKDIADGDKVHELDAPHIVEELVHQQKQAEEGQKARTLPQALEALAAAIAPLGERVPLNQTRIDLVRFRLIRTRIQRAAAANDMSLLRVFYVWFPEDNVNVYEIRDALPEKLPKHLRGYALEIDPMCWPRSVVDALASIDIKVPTPRELMNDLRGEASVAEEIQREESDLQN